MKIAFMGTEIRMNLVKEILGKLFPELDAVIMIDDSFLYEAETEKKLLQIREGIDGIIFGGSLPYELYHDIFHGYCPCTYLPKDSAAFHNALLKLSVKGIDLGHISIDNISYPAVKRIMETLELDMSQLVLIEHQSFINDNPDYYETLIEKHIESYQNHITKGAITTLFFVYERLKKEGIPVAYVTPTYDTIVRTIRQFLLEIHHRLSQEKGTLAVIILRLIPREELVLHSTGDYLESHEKLKAAEQIHYFARNNKATVITQADDQYTIIINASQLMKYTQELRIFPLLQLIWDNTRCNFSVGIGCGYDPWNSRLNAAIALKKASRLENAGVFISYSPVSVIGPLNFVDYDHSKAVAEQERILLISRKTRISEDIINRLIESLEQSKKNLITAHELSITLGISSRMSNRILSALEMNGYAEIISHMTMGKAGRPSNIYQIKL